VIVALINECIINAIAKETSATYSKINHFDRVASKKCSIIYNKESFCPNKCGIIDINVTLSPNKCGILDVNVPFTPNKCGIIDVNVTLSPNKCGILDVNVPFTFNKCGILDVNVPFTSNKCGLFSNKCGIIDPNVTLSPNKCGKMDLNVEEISQLRTIAYNMLLLWLIQGCNGCIIEQKPCEIVFYFFIIVINLSVIGSMRLANLPLTTASALNSLVPFVSMLENGAFSKTFRHQSTISVGLDQSLYILSKLSL